VLYPDTRRRKSFGRDNLIAVDTVPSPSTKIFLQLREHFGYLARLIIQNRRGGHTMCLSGEPTLTRLPQTLP
jgi:hypothetical protein